MDIKDSFSNFAKNISNGAAQGATQVAKKSGELVEISKLSLNINSNEDKIYEIYSKIGEMVYQKYRKMEQIDHDLKQSCKEITEIAEENEKLTARINKIKKLKKCLSCGEEMKLEVTYCPKCGLKQIN